MAEGMLVKFRCPHCQALLEAGTKLIGESGDCPNCKKEITVPSQDSEDEGTRTET